MTKGTEVILLASLMGKERVKDELLKSIEENNHKEIMFNSLMLCYCIAIENTSLEDVMSSHHTIDNDLKIAKTIKN